MVVGVLQFDLLIAGAESLKDKRRVVRSVKDRLHREHQVSVAEVAAQDRMDVAVMAIALVSSEGRRAGEVLDTIENKLRKLLDAEVGSVSRQILHGSEITEPASTGRDTGLDEEMLARGLGAQLRAQG